MKRVTWQEYNRFWQFSDVENMSYMCEYCDRYIEEIYGLSSNKVDRLKFIDTFMKSYIRHEMEKWHPRLASQAAINTLEEYIDYEYDGDPSYFKTDDKKDAYLAKNQLFWIGGIYSYIHCKTNMDSKEIIKKLPLEFMLDAYYPGHELSIDGFYKRVKWKLKEKTE